MDELAALRDECDALRAKYRRTVQVVIEYRNLLRSFCQTADTLGLPELTETCARAKIALAQEATATSAGPGTRVKTPTVRPEEEYLTTPLRFLEDAQRARVASRVQSRTVLASELLAARAQADAAAPLPSVDQPLQPLPHLASHLVLEALPAQGVCALAQTSRVWRDAVRLWRLHAPRTRLVLELRRSEVAMLASLRGLLAFAPVVFARDSNTQVSVPRALVLLVEQRVPLLVLVCRRVLSELTDRLSEDWNVETSTLGDLIMLLGSSLHVYLLFARELEEVSPQVHRCLRDREAVLESEGHLRQLLAALSHPSLVQRLEFYRAFVESLQRVSPSTHPDCMLLLSAAGALEQVLATPVGSGVVTAFKRAPRRTPAEASLLSSLHDLPGVLADAIDTRTIVKSDTARWLKREGRVLSDLTFVQTKVVLVLFPDFLLVATQAAKHEWKFRASFPVGGCLLSPHTIAGVEGAMALVSSHLATPMVLVLSSTAQCQSWLKMFALITADRRGSEPVEAFAVVDANLAPAVDHEQQMASGAPAANVLRSSWIEKRWLVVGISPFKKRLLALSEQTLAFYKRVGTVAGRVVPLSAIHTVELNDDATSFTVVAEQLPDLLVRCETAGDAALWVDAIREAMGKRGDHTLRELRQMKEDRVVDVAMPDGTHCILMLRDEETLESLLVHLCTRRRLESAHHQLLPVGGGAVLAPSAPVQELVGKSFRLVRKSGSERSSSPRGKSGTRKPLDSSGVLPADAPVSPRGTDNILVRSGRLLGHRLRASKPGVPQGDITTSGEARIPLPDGSAAEARSTPALLKRSASHDSIYECASGSFLLKVELPDHSFATLMFDVGVAAHVVKERACKRRNLDPSMHLLQDERGFPLSDLETLQSAEVLRLVGLRPSPRTREVTLDSAVSSPRKGSSGSSPHSLGDLSNSGSGRLASPVNLSPRNRDASMELPPSPRKASASLQRSSGARTSGASPSKGDSTSAPSSRKVVRPHLSQAGDPGATSEDVATTTTAPNAAAGSTESKAAQAPLAGSGRIAVVKMGSRSIPPLGSAPNSPQAADPSPLQLSAGDQSADDDAHDLAPTLPPLPEAPFTPEELYSLASVAETVDFALASPDPPPLAVRPSTPVARSAATPPPVLSLSRDMIDAASGSPMPASRVKKLSLPPNKPAPSAPMVAPSPPSPPSKPRFKVPARPVRVAGQPVDLTRRRSKSFDQTALPGTKWMAAQPGAEQNPPK